MNRVCIKPAFTVAEVLITLGIIGVVAALTMPVIMENVTERINSNRQANIAYKITQATDKMKSLGLLNGSYATTDDFVDELQKHLKIAKRCSANNIADCWPTEKVITGNGEEFEVSNAKTGKNLNIEGNTSNNVGLVLADGASIILTYNQSSSGIDVGEVITAQPKALPVGLGKSQEFAYTTNTTAAIDFVMDVNGKKGPNSETRDNKYHDIRSFKAARFYSGGCAGVDIPGVGCVVNLATSYECISENPYTNNDNCWAGAKKACDEIGMPLPGKGTLEKLYRMKNDYPDLPQSGKFWSTPENTSATAFGTNFETGNTTYNIKSAHGYGALCVGN
ncbi:MAG: type II secretion system protein [Candidatus Gastranaerophilaceae bacterium]